MLHFRLISVLAGVVLSVVVRAQSPAQVPAGLVAWFSGDGNVRDDVSGKNATVHGKVDFAPGHAKQALAFPGGASYLSEPFTQSGPFTVDFWAKAVGPRQGRYVSLFSSGLPGHYDPFFQIEFDGAGNYQFEVGNDGDVITTKIGRAKPVFQHLVVTYDGSLVTTYLDGQQQHQDKWTRSTLGFEILKLGINRDQDRGFRGMIDELHVFNRALQPHEIQQLFKARNGLTHFNGPPRLTLAGQWRCSPVPPCATGIATIKQNGDQLVFVNERGSRSDGKLLSNGANMIAYQWGQNGLHAVAGANDNSILWENKTRWDRIGSPGNVGWRPEP